MAKKTFKKKNYLKNLPKVGGTIALTMAMASVLATPANASEVDENAIPAADIQETPIVEEVAATGAEVLEPVEANETIAEENTETVSENEEVAENNEQVEQENNTAAEENETITGGALTDPELDLPEAPEVPKTEDTDAEGYNEEITDYNEKVDDYNGAVDDYNDGVDDYNAEADAYDQQAQEQYEEDKAAFEEAKTEHENAEQKHEEELKQYEEDSKAYEEYLDAMEQYEEDKKVYDEELAQYEKDQAQHETDTKAFEDYLAALEEYEAAKKIYDEELAQYEQDQTQHETDTKAYEDYLAAMEKYEAAKKIYDEELAQYEKDQTQHETDTKAYEDYVDAMEQYEEDKKVYDKELAQYEKDQAQHETDTKAYEDYLDALAKYEADKKIYDADQAQYKKDYDQYQKDSEAYQNYLAAKDTYDAAYKTYRDALAQYDADKAAYDLAYQNYLTAKEAYDQEKATFEASYETEVKIYDEVTEYNKQVEDKNTAIENKNDALEDDLHANTAENIDGVGTTNTGVTVDQEVLDTLNGYDDLDTQYTDLMDAGAALDSHPGKNAALGSKEYADYLAAVEAYNDKVAQYNDAVDEYNAAVDTYNAAVDTYNENKKDTIDSTTGGTSATGTAVWGNIKIGQNTTFSHIDVKYAAAAAKDVTVETDAQGNETTTYSDSVTEYTITGVYINEEAAKKNPNSFGVSYKNNENSTVKTQGLKKESLEFRTTSHNGASLDPDEGVISFYVTLKDGENNTHGITVTMNDNTVYPEGTYYAVSNKGKLGSFEDANGNKLKVVTIDGKAYYDISGQSVFVVSALTCDGMGTSGWGNNVTLNPDGLDLVLNLQTMIEVHKADNAKKISYTGYEKGKTAQATAPTDPGEFEGEEPVAPPAPVEPTFEMTEPNPVEEPTAPTAPTAPTVPDEVPEPGTPPVAPTAPTVPDEVPEPGTPPVAPTAPTVPDEVPEPGTPPVAPTAPTAPGEVAEPGTPPVAPIAPNMPDEVPNPGDAPEGPGEFTGQEPEAPTPTHRLNHADKLEKLIEKLIMEIPEEPKPEDPGIPVPAWDPGEPIDDGEINILDEDVPLAAAPKTGDLSGLWAAISGLSLGGMAFLNRKRKEEEV